MNCLILAAGTGSRLRPITNHKPKCLTPLLGKPLLAHQIEVLNYFDIKNISIVTGYLHEKIERLGYNTFHNNFYESTNMVESLFAARDFLENSPEDIIISYGDIVYQKNNLKTVLKSEADISVMIDTGWLDLWSLRNEDPLDDAETLKIDSYENITEIGKKPKSLQDMQGQYTGLLKISKNKIKEFLEVYDSIDKNLTKNMYLTDFLQILIDKDWQVKAAKVNHGWLEIDTVADLEIYEKLAKNEELDFFWKKDA